jgi:hypothetical protein
LLRAEGFTDIRLEVFVAPLRMGRGIQNKLFDRLAIVDVTEARVRRADAAKSDALSDMVANGEGGFRQNLCASSRFGDECRRTDHGSNRVASGMLRGLREKRDPHPQRPEGQDHGRGHLQFSPNRALLAVMFGLVGLDPVKDIRWVSDPSLQPNLPATAFGGKGLTRASAPARFHRAFDGKEGLITHFHPFGFQKRRKWRTSARLSMTGNFLGCLGAGMLASRFQPFLRVTL